VRGGKNGLSPSGERSKHYDESIRYRGEDGSKRISGGYFAKGGTLCTNLTFGQ